MFGTVNNRGIFKSNSFDLHLGRIYIFNIRIYFSSSYNNVSDNVMINYSESFTDSYYNFTHPNGDAEVEITINRKFPRVYHISLQKSRSSSFEVVYSPLYI